MRNLHRAFVPFQIIPMFFFSFILRPFIGIRNAFFSCCCCIEWRKNTPSFVFIIITVIAGWQSRSWNLLFLYFPRLSASCRNFSCFQLQARICAVFSTFVRGFSFRFEIGFPLRIIKLHESSCSYSYCTAIQYDNEQEKKKRNRTDSTHWNWNLQKEKKNEVWRISNGWSASFSPALFIFEEMVLRCNWHTHTHINKF